MSDSPRPVHPVSAHMQRSFLSGALALAGAMVLPASGAAVAARHTTHAPVPAAHPHAPAAHTASASRAHAQPSSREQVRYAAAYRGKAAMQQAIPHLHGNAGHTGKIRAVPTMAKARSTRQNPAVIVSKVRQPERLGPPPSGTVQQKAVEDRVHAWYKAQHPESSPRISSNSQDGLKAAEVKAYNAPANAPTLAAPITRMSPAALQRDEALHAASVTQPSATSTDDSAAFAEESHIPSTAPTERTAAPFAHGDFNVAGSAANSATAPVLRGSSPAASALLASKPRLDPVPVEIAAQQAVTTPIEPPAPARFTPADQDAANSASLVKVNLYDSAGKLILIPPMKGTHEILVHQNQMAQTDGLQRISNDTQLAQLRRAHLLVALPETAGIGVDERLPLNRRYARPWTVRFLNDLARAHYAWFHTPLIVTSAVRTVAFQRHLVLVNGNAAPPTGDIASPHLYGQAVDIAKHSMSTAELAWMRAYLTPLEAQGKIDVEEEFQQACFHISVYRSYLGGDLKQPAPAQELPKAYAVQQARAVSAKRRRIPTALLAMRLR